MKRNKPWKGGRARYQLLRPHLELQSSCWISKQPKTLKVLVEQKQLGMLMMSLASDADRCYIITGVINKSRFLYLRVFLIIPHLNVHRHHHGTVDQRETIFTVCYLKIALSPVCSVHPIWPGGRLTADSYTWVSVPPEPLPVPESVPVNGPVHQTKSHLLVSGHSPLEKTFFIYKQVTIGWRLAFSNEYYAYCRISFQISWKWFVSCYNTD